MLFKENRKTRSISFIKEKSIGFRLKIKIERRRLNFIIVFVLSVKSFCPSEAVQKVLIKDKRSVWKAFWQIIWVSSKIFC